MLLLAMLLSELVHLFGCIALCLWECLLVHVSVPAIVCLLSSLLSHSCIILWLSHQIWRIGLAKLLSADSSLYATESASIPVCTQICQYVSTKMCFVHLSSFLCLCIHTFALFYLLFHFHWCHPLCRFQWAFLFFFYYWFFFFCSKPKYRY